jgi:VWFA-related protein
MWRNRQGTDRGTQPALVSRHAGVISSPRTLFAILAGALIAVTGTAQTTEEPLFKAGTRLVEVHVIVRRQRVPPTGVRESLAYFFDSGPPFGPPGTLVTDLTKGDFTLLDQGKPQPIVIFGVDHVAGPGQLTPPFGFTSNRTDDRGQPLESATVVLVDLLNTPWELSEYARQGAIELLRSLTEDDTHIAVYSLGEHLHILRDFTDDPKEWPDQAVKVEGSQKTLAPALKTALADYGDIIALGGGEQAAMEIHGRITIQAAKKIVQHFAGLPGRRNLVWLSQTIRLPPAVTELLRRANIVLYPVSVRGFGGFGSLEGEYATREAGTASGGRGFFDAKDLTFAVRTAQEDSGSSYVLGYYPSDRMLDGKFHRITVNLSKTALDCKSCEIHYRSGYLATKDPAAVPTQTLAEVLDNPLNVTGIGLSARVTPDPRHPGLYDLQLLVDLRDIRLDHRDGHTTGLFDFAVRDPSSDAAAKAASVHIDLTDASLAAALKNGFRVNIPDVEPMSGEIQMAVRDRATGIAGALRIRVGSRREQRQ